MDCRGEGAAIEMGEQWKSKYEQWKKQKGESRMTPRMLA